MAARQVEWADFDRFLDDPAKTLAAFAAFFGFEADARQIDSIARGPLMTRYSKALEFEYSAILRRDLIGDASRRNAREIDDALAMLHRAAEKSPLLARSLARSGEA